MIQDCTRRRCPNTVAREGVQGGADSLLNHNEDQLGLIVLICLKALENLWDLKQLHSLQLTLGDTIPIDHNLLWEAAVLLFIEKEKQKNTKRLHKSLP